MTGELLENVQDTEFVFRPAQSEDAAAITALITEASAARAGIIAAGAAVDSESNMPQNAMAQSNLWRCLV